MLKTPQGTDSFVGFSNTIRTGGTDVWGTEQWGDDYWGVEYVDINTQSPSAPQG